MDDLDRRLSSSPRHAKPARDLWFRIGSHLERGSARPKRIVLAAAAVFLFAAGALSGRAFTAVADTAPSGEVTPGNSDPLHAAAAVQQAGTAYLAALARLRALGPADELIRSQGYESALGVVSIAAAEVSSALNVDIPSGSGDLTSAARDVHAAASRHVSELARRSGS